MHPSTEAFPRRRPCVALTLLLALGSGAAHGADYRYHGELMDGEVAADGAYDLRVRSFAQPGATHALGDAIELSSVAIRDGRFSVALDLPDDADGITWVEVAVRRSGSGGDYEVLGVPQPLGKANSTCPGAWALDGNSGVPANGFLGTVDTRPLQLRANDQPVAQFTGFDAVTAPNINFGFTNLIRTNGTVGATIGGGGPLNAISDSYGTIAGGAANFAGDDNSNGENRQNSAMYATVSGGNANQAGGLASVVPGGSRNCAGGDGSFAAGTRAKVRRSNQLIASVSGCTTAPSSGTSTGDHGTFVWADSTELDFVSSAPKQFLIRADGGVGINTATFGNAVDLRQSELILKNTSANPNTDLTLLSGTHRGYGIAVVPGAGGAAGDFYISETDARTANVAFSNRFRIDAAGTTFVQGGAVGNLSDARLKKNIADIPSPLDTLLSLRGHAFEYVDPSKSMNTPGRRMGFIAQEVQAAIPQWVAPTGAEGYLAVTPAGFEALAVEAMRELKIANEVQLEQLRQENDAHDSRLARENASLRAQLAAQQRQLAALMERIARVESAGDASSTRRATSALR